MGLEIGTTIYRKKDGVAMRVVTQGVLFNGVMRSWACSWTDPATGEYKEDIFSENELMESSATD